jgi:hypothetical protein
MGVNAVSDLFDLAKTMVRDQQSKMLEHQNIWAHAAGYAQGFRDAINQCIKIMEERFDVKELVDKETAKEVPTLAEAQQSAAPSAGQGLPAEATGVCGESVGWHDDSKQRAEFSDYVRSGDYER